MGKISVSLPDELETELDRYAREHDLPVSRVVAQALEAFFRGGTEPPPDDGQDILARRQLELLQAHTETMRSVLADTLYYMWGPGNPLLGRMPGPLPPPPWTAFQAATERLRALIPPLPTDFPPVGNVHTDDEER